MDCKGFPTTAFHCVLLAGVGGRNHGQLEEWGWSDPVALRYLRYGKVR